MSDIARPLILVVEDDPTIRKLVALIARRRGVESICVESCEQALALLGSHNFNLVLMDWTLPLHNGLECTKTIRDGENGSARHVPIIAMTANLMPGDRETCLDSGMDDFIGKPFTISQLNEVLDHWLGDGVSIIPFGPFGERESGDQPAAGHN